MVDISVSEKYMLTIKEAAIYFGIGMKRICSLADEHLGECSVTVGDWRMISGSNLKNIF